MKKVGITGGIGAGKSYVCQLLEEEGFPVFYTDKEAKAIMNQHPKVIQSIKKIFGDAVYVNGEINRPWLAQQIFGDDSVREKLNQIVHPEVYHSFHVWCEKQNGLVFIESALMLETNLYQQLDAVILVIADQNLRVQRVMQRDTTSQEKVLERILSQSNDDEKIKLADFIIQNDENHNVRQQLEEILKTLKR